MDQIIIHFVLVLSFNASFHFPSPPSRWKDPFFRTLLSRVQICAPRSGTEAERKRSSDVDGALLQIGGQTMHIIIPHTAGRDILIQRGRQMGITAIVFLTSHTRKDEINALCCVTVLGNENGVSVLWQARDLLVTNCSKRRLGARTPSWEMFYGDTMLMSCSGGETS